MSEGSESQDDELEGVWTVVSATHNGKPCVGTGAEFTFTRGIIRITPPRQNSYPILYRLFPEMVPKGIDMSSRHPDGGWKLARGIYQIDKCNLRICHPSSPHTEPYKDRPGDFDSGAGRDLWVLRRTVEGDAGSKQHGNLVGLLRRLASMLRRRSNTGMSRC